MKTALLIAMILCLTSFAGFAGDENSAKSPLLQSPRPPYPVQAIQNQVQGSVTFKLTIKNGQIVKVTGTGPEQLATPCAEWIKEHWQFKKGMTGVYTVSLSFELPGKSSGPSPTPSESPESAESPTPAPAPVPSISPSESSAE
jgi:hypothetical protein